MRAYEDVTGRTLPAMLQRQAASFGDRPFLALGESRWSHSDAWREAAGWAGALGLAGVGRGDRVAVMCSNRIEFVQLFLGCGWLGAVTVPVNTASMGPQIAYYVADSETRLLVMESCYLARLDGADFSGTRLEMIWVLDDGDPGLALPRSALGIPVARYPAAAEPLAPAAVQPGEPLAILYTSGTTGPAKGVVCPHAQYYWWGRNTAEILGIGGADVLCTTLPLFHINALNTLAQAALAGCQVAYEPRFSASGFWAAMHTRRATVVYLLGAMVPILLAQPAGAGEKSHKVRIGLGPGVPAAAAASFLQRVGVRLLEGYGSTETNFVIATAPDSPRNGVMGWLRPGFQARVADEDDAELPPGEAGELLLRTDVPYAFASGYFNMPQKTVEAWRNLWFHTGDRVVRDADGAFRFIDRIKDAIRRRGENISSFEVEQVLLSHACVAAAAVFPVQSELAEDEVMAALILHPGQRLDPAELAGFCDLRLPKFAVPRYIEVVEDLPRTENGKVQKYKLRERGVAAGTWDRAAQPGGVGRPPERTGRP
ncbi:MAG: ATP-dependent acyl-CoA ligase [Lautropia sp.]|nr:ATP-dependent acyl-CoA ligase [Lautropia sp.]